MLKAFRYRGHKVEIKRTHLHGVLSRVWKIWIDDEDTESWSAVSEKTAIKYARDLLNKTKAKKKKPAGQNKSEPEFTKYEVLINTQPFEAKFVRGGGCSPR